MRRKQETTEALCLLNGQGDFNRFAEYKGALEDKINKVKRALALDQLNARYEWMMIRNSYISEHYGDNRIGFSEKQTIMVMDLKLGSITAD